MCTRLALIGEIIALWLIIQGCKKNFELNSISHKNYEENWLISGRIDNKEFVEGEIIALSSQGAQYNTSIREDQSFAFNLPANETYVVYVLSEQKQFSPHKERTSGNQEHNALLTFEEDAEQGMRDTLRLPSTSSASTLDLGNVKVKGEYAYPRNSPATKLDFDHDGIPDAFDFDDQNDGLRDVTQKASYEPLTICHQQEQTMELELLSLFSHLEHQDTIGACEATINNANNIDNSFHTKKFSIRKKNQIPLNSTGIPPQIHEPLIIEKIPSDQ